MRQNIRRFGSRLMEEIDSQKRELIRSLLIAEENRVASTEELRQQVRETISEARALRERLQVLHQLQADPRMSRDARLPNGTDASARQRALSEVVTIYEMYLASVEWNLANGVV
jgi:hypothetical protein